MNAEIPLSITVAVTAICITGVFLVIRKYGIEALERPSIMAPWNQRKQRVWRLLEGYGGVVSSIIDANPRVSEILQPAFHGALHPLGFDFRTRFLAEQQIISTPDNDWIASFITSDIADAPNDGQPAIFKAQATAFVFARRLQGAVPEVSFVNKSYRRRSFLYMPSWKVSQGELTYCEGVFTDKFDVYARPGEQIEALAFAAPDLLEDIVLCADASDIYFLGEYMYFLMPVWKTNERNVAKIFETSKRLVAEANSNLPSNQR